jgi:hypothetical protein
VAPHFGNTVRQFINERFPNKWIGRGDLAPQITRPNNIGHFPLGLYEKYRILGENFGVLRHRITDEIATVTEVMLVNTWREIEYRFEVCRITIDAHTETY